MLPKPITIPKRLLPKDGRFGSGPSLVPDEALKNLAKNAHRYMGNSHRKENVKELIGRFQEGCRDFFSLPDGWAVLLGNGGATFFWDALAFCGIEKKSQHLCFGEFSARFAEVVKDAPHLEPPQIIEAELGMGAVAEAASDVDFYALTHNETSTGVLADISRPGKTSDKASGAGGALAAVDGTSGAGGIEWDPAETDIYYFSLQKAFAADGGLWVALCSPAAIARFQKLAGERWAPNSLNLALAYENSLKQQILNTPAVATLYLAVHFLEWAQENGGENGKEKGKDKSGGLKWAAERSRKSSQILYHWAEKSDWAEPFVKDPAARSPVVVTIELSENVSAADISAILRENGVVDTDPYRKLDKNLLRFGLFPSRDPADVEALTKCLDYLADRLT